MSVWLGSVLLGLGLALAIISSIGLYAVQAFYKPAYGEVLGYKPAVERAGELLYSEDLGAALDLYAKVGSALSLAKSVKEDLARLRALLGSATATLGELSAAAEKLRGALSQLRELAEGYEKLVEAKAVLDDLYAEVHSSEYNETIQALNELLESPLIPSDTVSKLRYARDRMVELQAAAAELKALLADVKALSAEEVNELLGSVEAGASALEAVQEAGVKAKLEEVKGMVDAVYSSNAWEALNALEKLYSSLPPSEVRSMVEGARSAYPKLKAALELLEQYPPAKVQKLLGAGLATGLALIALGAILIRRGQKKAVRQRPPYAAYGTL